MSTIPRSDWMVPFLSNRDFDRISKLAFDYCGLHIEAGKEELVASRLGKIMRRLGIESYGAYYDHVTGDSTSTALVEMINNLTTNHTSFFREMQHFEFLKTTVFPALVSRPTLDVWSAASSTGEEPYSLALAAHDFFAGMGPQVRILGTDISTRVLETAQNGIYEANRVQGIPGPILHRYFLKGHGNSAGLYRVKQQIRDSVQFRRLNLAESFHGLRTQFPLILCRNVMIYFNASTQEELIARFYQQLEPGGYLFIGHSESLNRLKHQLEYVQPAIYRKPGLLKATSGRGRAA